ncbi:methylenetetrahydrofolate reductase [Candidatus Methanoperedens nitratireducens]|uniref:5,10-methylenetetrahydrofolate reductase n=1 Tax=Candidatus Methanoperedens nitratireducens TaxID=1392998 RepID=A0A284VIV6_9EURY|nr:methylenetetrahydrofolate reductase [Candidatus Methanoperedens nitroreducens]SNQ59215.1 5,10-methylenetetrahydrofolate reductase [Candidatus Methanoperedens nitroreducens]
MSFRKKLDSKKFIITAEISPPKGTDITGMQNDASMIKDVVDAINITDNQRAVMRMSSLAACSILSQNGYETIMHLTCRDKNRLALQSELLGASALGIHNVLVITGDHPAKGDHEGAKPVYDFDSVQLLGLIKELNRGFDFSGNPLHGKPNLCAGAVAGTGLNELPFIKLEKKIKMGARFIQTQAVFDTRSFSEFMDKIKNSETFREVKILAGIIPLRSEKNAAFLNKNMAGIKVPEDIIKQMRGARNPVFKGMEIAAELIKELRSVCDGVHIMPVGNHEKTAGILEMAGIK